MGIIYKGENICKCPSSVLKILKIVYSFFSVGIWYTILKAVTKISVVVNVSSSVFLRLFLPSKSNKWIHSAV